MTLRRRRSYYQKLAEFERGSIIKLKKSGIISTMLQRDLVGMYLWCMIFGNSGPENSLPQGKCGLTKHESPLIEKTTVFTNGCGTS
ncbi:hypothetical protein TNCV_362641 [Trichonephila clavipes]|nr:hypothetical protein TNCV_362641 [Trichonephila clavipes]